MLFRRFRDKLGIGRGGAYTNFRVMHLRRVAGAVKYDEARGYIEEHSGSMSSSAYDAAVASMNSRHPFSQGDLDCIRNLVDSSVERARGSREMMGRRGQDSNIGD